MEDFELLEAIAIRLEAIASSLEAIAVPFSSFLLALHPHCPPISVSQVALLLKACLSPACLP